MTAAYQFGLCTGLRVGWREFGERERLSSFPPTRLIILTPQLRATKKRPPSQHGVYLAESVYIPSSARIVRGAHFV